jgi:hypothetical protein
VSYRVDRQRLLELAREHCVDYARACPFPHVVFDDLFSAEVLDAVLCEFPAPGDGDWWRFESTRERKLAANDETMLGPTTRQLLQELNSGPMIDFLNRLTGIPGLVPDPHFIGGGLHQIQAGGYLDVHADFNLHPYTGLQRRLNLLLYLNKDWPDEYGGALELWRRGGKGPDKVVAPVFGRCVIFTTSDQAYHGHPKPLTCPPDRTRRSLALYYYSLPDQAVVAHNTVFRGTEVVPADVPGWRRAWRRGVPEPVRMAVKRTVTRRP